MAKFAIECPKCGSVNTASNFILAKKVIKCGTCNNEIDIRTSKLTSKVCPHCEKVFVYDQSKPHKDHCPACGKRVDVNATATAKFKMVKINCPQCACSIEVDETKDTYFCPICDLQLDVKKIEEAINEKTAAIIINSPNNPTGVIYTEENIIALCDALRRGEEKYGHPIYLISDEPYRELAFDGKVVPYLTKYYDDTIVSYSFSKSLSIPGERIGYILVCPRCQDFTAVYQAVCGAGRSLGFVCAPSMLQKILPSCLGKTSDITIYDRNRRLLLEKLSSYGLEMIRPDGAFYLFIKSPSGDANEFCERAKSFEILIVPSDDFGYPGYARLAYCVTTEQIERAMPAFERLANSYKD